MGEPEELTLYLALAIRGEVHTDSPGPHGWPRRTEHAGRPASVASGWTMRLGRLYGRPTTPSTFRARHAAETPNLHLTEPPGSGAG